MDINSFVKTLKSLDNSNADVLRDIFTALRGQVDPIDVIAYLLHREPKLPECLTQPNPELAKEFDVDFEKLVDEFLDKDDDLTFEDLKVDDDDEEEVSTKKYSNRTNFDYHFDVGGLDTCQLQMKIMSVKTEYASLEDDLDHPVRVLIDDMNISKEDAWDIFHRACDFESMPAVLTITVMEDEVDSYLSKMYSSGWSFYHEIIKPVKEVKKNARSRRR